MKESGTSSVFDWGLYGLLIRKRRIDAGYKKAVKFAASLWRRTRVMISRDTLYKIEQGRQQPTAEQFMALNIVLYKRPFPTEVLDLCFSNEWKEIQWGDAESVPEKWKRENYRVALAEMERVLAEAEQNESKPSTDRLPHHVDIDKFLMGTCMEDDPNLFLGPLDCPF